MKNKKVLNIVDSLVNVFIGNGFPAREVLATDRRVFRDLPLGLSVSLELNNDFAFLLYNINSLTIMVDDLGRISVITAQHKEYFVDEDRFPVQFSEVLEDLMLFVELLKNPELLGDLAEEICYNTL